MGATILPLLGVAIIALALIAGLIAPQANKRRPVTFKNLDEENAVYDVTRWAAKQLNISSVIHDCYIPCCSGCIRGPSIGPAASP
jgi:hypothetical protein